MTQPPTRTRPMRILSLGLPRTGSFSMAKAYSLLNLHNVWHGITKSNAPHDWLLFGRAADASFPSLPSYTGQPFTRADWDELLGGCEAVTDMGALFARELVETYPEAKVVLVHRSYERWAASMEAIYSSLFGPVPDFITNVIHPLTGGVVLGVARKAVLGWGGAKDVNELRAKQREVFEAHYRDITAMVPEEKLLHYRMGDGWAPLCKFLEVPVPDVPFPHENESAALLKMVAEGYRKEFIQFAGLLAPYVVPIAAAGVGMWWYMR